MRRLLFRNGVPAYWPLFIPVALGVGFVVAGVNMAAPTINFALHATRTEARFVGAIQGKSGSFYHPMFSFAASDGTVRTFTATAGSARYPYKVGDKASVLYDPADPGMPRLESFRELWFTPLAIGVPGLLLTAFGMVLLTGARSRAAQASR